MLDHSGSRLELRTRTWLRTVVGRASTLAERREGLVVPVVGHDEQERIDARWDRWVERVADGDQARFEARLRFDEMTPESARALLGEHCLPNAAPMPRWAELLAAVGQRMRTSEAPTSTVPSNRIAFEELLGDFALEAQARLEAAAGPAYGRVVPAAHEQLRRVLLLTLGWLAGQTLALEFGVFRQDHESPLHRLVRRAQAEHSDRLYRAFITEHRADGLQRLSLEYASLARLLASVTQMWVDNTAELLMRLDADWDVLRTRLMDGRELGRARWIMTGLSDRHQHGRGVAIVHFESGDKVVYKPKDLAIEAGWYRLLRDLGPRFSGGALTVVEREGYGWVEHARARGVTSEAEVQRYYHRVGGMLGVLHLLSATDCHYENVIACGDQPVLVDGETVLHHSRALRDVPEGFGAQASAVRRLECSVLRPGLLPQWSMAPQDAGAGEDRSGLGSEAEGVSRREFAAYDGLGSDDLQLAPRKIAIGRGNSVPVLDGARTSVLGHQQTFVDGFEQATHELVGKRQRVATAIDRFAGQRSRFIFRPTQVYADLLEDANHPDFMRDGADRCIVFEALARPQAGSGGKPAWWPMVRSELAALSRLDVPTFFAMVDDDRLIAEDGTAVAGVLRESSLGFVQRRLARLDDQHIAEQVELIWGSLYSRDIDRSQLDAAATAKATAVPERVPSMGEDDFVAEAVEIGERLVSDAIEGDDDSLAWIGFDHLPGTGRFALQPIAGSLYAGTAGVGLFFASLYAATGDSSWRARARAAVRHVMADAHAGGREQVVTASHGAACGAASIAYALTQMAEHTADDRYVEAALAAAARITPELAVADRVHDICGGVAGTIVGLLPLWRQTGDARLREVLVACGQRLLDARITETNSGVRGWLTIEGHPLTGMSHGSAGIAMALSRLGHALQRPDFVEAALEALDYERATYVPHCENWPDFRDCDDAVGEQCMTSWCHGAPGIGLARATMLAAHDEAVKVDLDIAAKTTRRLGVGACDNLCCGNFGRIDALLTMGVATDRAEWIDQARSQAAAATAQARRLGGFDLLPGVPRGTLVPGFFQGLSGVGYEYLRLAQPQRFGSVLSWEDRRG